MSDQPNTITLTEHEYKEILDQLETFVKKQKLDEEEAKGQALLFSKLFWDNFFTKILTMVVSLKNWTLMLVLFMPYQLLKMQLISGDNYTSIITVVAPVVVGLREFSKKAAENTATTTTTTEGTTSTTSQILQTIRKKFSI